MNHFINLQISNSINFLIEKNDSNYSKHLKFLDLTNSAHAIILNNLIFFLYKKLTPFLFHEVKNYLNSLYIKIKNEQNKTKKNNQNINPHELFFNLNNIKNNNINNNINIKNQKQNQIFFALKEKKNTNYQNNKKIYIPKSEQKKKHSTNNKYKNFEKNKKNINLSHVNGRKYINEITSIKTQIIKNSKNKIKGHFNSKRKKEHSLNSSRNNSISNSNQFINTNSYNYKSTDKNKKIISNILYTNRKYNNNKDYLLTKKNKVHSSSKNKNNLTKSHPLLSEKILYQLSFNNNSDNNNTNYHKNYTNNSLKKNKNNLQIYQVNYEPNYCHKNIRIKNPIINLIKSKNYSKKSNSYSTLKKNNIINTKKYNFKKNNFDSYHINNINGGENKNINDNNIDEDKNNMNKINNNNEEKRNSLNKKYKLLNEEMMKKIKNTIDDNLKVMFNFSYGNFLSKESEQESKEYSLEKSKYFEERKDSGEKL